MNLTTVLTSVEVIIVGAAEIIQTPQLKSGAGGI